MRNFKIQKPVLVSKKSQYEFETINLASNFLVSSSSKYPKTVMEVCRFVCEKLSGSNLSPAERAQTQPAFTTRRDMKGSRGQFLTSLSDPKGMLPVSELGCKTLIAFAVNDLWYSEFMNSGLTFSSLVNDLVGSGMNIGQKAQNELTTLISCMSSLRLIRESSTAQEVDQQFIKLVDDIYLSAFNLQIASKVFSTTNDPVVLGLSLINKFVTIVGSLVMTQTGTTNHTSVVKDLPVIVGMSNASTLMEMFKLSELSKMITEMRQSLTSFKFSELASFNQWYLDLGFTTEAKYKMSSIFIDDVYSVALKALEINTQANSFMDRIGDFCKYTILNSAHEGKVVPENVRIASVLFLDTSKTVDVSIKYYDITTELSKSDEQFMNFLNSFVDFIKEICYVNPKITDFYSAQCYISEDSAVNRVIRINLSSRLKRNFNLIRVNSKKPTTSLAPCDDVFKVMHYEFDSIKESSRENVYLETSRNLDKPGTLGSGSSYSVVCNGFDQTFRELVVARCTFYDVIVNENDVDYQIKSVVSAFTIKPNHRYSKFVFGRFYTVSDKFTSRTIDPLTCDNVELFLCFTPEEASNPNLEAMYEKRIAEFISTEDRIVREDVDLINPPSVISQYSNLSRFIQVQAASGKKVLTDQCYSYLLDRFNSVKVGGNNYSLLNDPDFAFPKRATIDEIINLKMYLPLKYLSDNQIELITSYPSHSICGPILPDSGGSRTWVLSIAKSNSVPQAMKNGNLPDSAFLELEMNFNRQNLGFGDRSVYLKNGQLTITYRYDDPVLDKLVRYGSTFAYGYDGVMDSHQLLVNFEPKLLTSANSRRLINGLELGMHNSIYSSIFMLYYKIIANIYLCLNHLWLKNPRRTPDYDLLSKVTANLIEFVEAQLDPTVYVSDVGGITGKTISDLITDMVKIKDSAGTVATKPQDLSDAIRTFLSDYDGEDIQASVLYNLASYMVPNTADFAVLQKLIDRDPYVPFVKKPTIVDSVELLGLESYLPDEVVKSISDCACHYINDVAF